MFSGGNDALKAFFLKNIVFPPLADDNHVDGAVNVSFVVEKDGSISMVLAQRSLVSTYGDTTTGIQDLSGSCNSLFVEAAKSACEAMPRWQPAMKDNQPVRFRKYLIVIFGEVRKDFIVPNAINIRILGKNSVENTYQNDKKPYKDMHLYAGGDEIFVSGINKNICDISETDMDFFAKKAKVLAVDIEKIKKERTGSDVLVDFTNDSDVKDVSFPLYKGTRDGLDDYMKSHLSTSFGVIYVNANFVVETDGTVSCPIVTTGKNLKANKMVIQKLRKTKKWQPAMKDGVPVRSRVSHVFSYRTITTTVKVKVPVYSPVRNNGHIYGGYRR